MQLLRAMIIGLLVFGFTPGVPELLIDGAHLILEGHSAHAAEHEGHDEHAGLGPEHGCNGWHHTCPCHSSLGLLPSLELRMPVVELCGLTHPAGSRESGPDGVSHSLERPPRV